MQIVSIRDNLHEISKPVFFFFFAFFLFFVFVCVWGEGGGREWVGGGEGVEGRKYEKKNQYVAC